MNEALAVSRSSGSSTATTAVAGVGRCRVCRPLTTSRGLRSSGMPAAAHSAGSSIGERLAESADVVIEVAADGANPKVTVLPSYTRPQCGQGRVGAHRGTALPDHERAVRGACPILAVAWRAATSNLAAPTGIGGYDVYIPAQLPSRSAARRRVARPMDTSRTPCDRRALRRRAGLRRRPAPAAVAVRGRTACRGGGRPQPLVVVAERCCTVVRGRWPCAVTLGELADCPCHRVAWGHGQPGAPRRSRCHPRRARRCPGGSARLREDQWQAVAALVEERRRALVVQRTGWGKSAVYFVATALLRRRGSGPTVIVSPLLALMRNQVEAAARAGIRARTINSANPEEWDAINEEVERGEVDVLLVSPERLNSVDFRDQVLPKLAATTGLLVVDEAHCISDWGHDFRPDYRRLRAMLAELPPACRCWPPPRPPTRGSPRTWPSSWAPARGEALVLRGPLDRESLRLGVRPAAGRRAPPGLARRAPGRAAGLRDHLHADRRRGRGGHRLPAAARLHGGLLHGPDGERRPAAGRGRPAGEPGQGAGRDLGAGHGLRQAGPGLRGPPRLAVLADRLLPAGRPRGARRGARRGAAAAGQGGRGHLALLRRHRLPARGAGAPDPRGPRRRGTAAVRAGAGGRWWTFAAPGWRRC